MSFMLLQSSDTKKNKKLDLFVNAETVMSQVSNLSLSHPTHNYWATPKNGFQYSMRHRKLRQFSFFILVHRGEHTIALSKQTKPLLHFTAIDSLRGEQTVPLIRAKKYKPNLMGMSPFTFLSWSYSDGRIRFRYFVVIMVSMLRRQH